MGMRPYRGLMQFVTSSVLGSGLSLGIDTDMGRRMAERSCLEAIVAAVVHRGASVGPGREMRSVWGAVPVGELVGAA